MSPWVGKSMDRKRTRRQIADAARIARAMKDVPPERRMDAVATAVDAFVQTGGHLCVDIDYPPGPPARRPWKAKR